jgi:ABC-type nitrate/sulfonate/bicarbonate transport system permease component
MHKKPKRLKIYASKWHLRLAFLLIILPFLFFFLFSKFAHIVTGQLFLDLGVSVFRLAIAYLVSVALAWVLGVSFYRGRRSEVALPIFDVLQSFPTFAALPLATLAFGASEVTVFISLVITVIWPILFSILSSLKLQRRDWEEVTEIYPLPRLVYFRKFLWPISVPGLVTGSIIGLGEGWEALVATEIIVGPPNGLGGFFQAFSSSVSVTAFGILGLLLLIFTVNKILWIPLLDQSHKLLED